MRINFIAVGVMNLELFRYFIFDAIFIHYNFLLDNVWGRRRQQYSLYITRRLAMNFVEIRIHMFILEK